MKKSFVFAYGSNLDPARMTRRVPSATPVGNARLEGYELRFHKRGWDDGTGKANALLSHGEAVVHGVVYEVEEAELAALDVHETGYERQLLDLWLAQPGDEVVVDAWVYLARPEAIDDVLVPTRGYLEHVLKGAREHGLPSAFIDELEALRTDD